jgi:hypothetical protein
MNALARFQIDPAQLGWPTMLPVELALREHTPRELCLAYGVGQDDWDRLRADPLFVAEVRRCVAELQKEGMRFKVKARLQSEELLKKSWEMIHDSHETVPPAVKADLIKYTIRAAGLDGSRDQANAVPLNPLQIQINLG